MVGRSGRCRYVLSGLQWRILFWLGAAGRKGLCFVFNYPDNLYLGGKFFRVQFGVVVFSWRRVLVVVATPLLVYHCTQLLRY